METFVKMNEIHIAEAPTILGTVVGSCIALCLWDGRLQIGGMAHIMMPEGNGNRHAPPGKYADRAVKALVDQMLKHGSSLKILTAACIGGASMFQNPKVKIEPVGQRNYRVVQNELVKFGIPIVIEAVGGPSGRKIILNCSDGAVTVSTLSMSN
ncbi:MAG TPA: chemotaxis protein CheD [bacterium]